MQCSMKISSCDSSFTSEMRSEGALIFERGGTAALTQRKYIKQQSILGAHQCRFHTLRSRSEQTISLFGVDYKTANNSHNEQNFLPNLG